MTRHEYSVNIALNHNEQDASIEKKQSCFQLKNIKIVLLHSARLGLFIGISVIFMELRLYKYTETQKDMFISWRNELAAKTFFSNAAVSIQLAYKK